MNEQQQNINNEVLARNDEVDESCFVDDTFTFRHIVYPHEIVVNPSFIISIFSKVKNKTYKYGCWIVPDKKDLMENIVPLRVFENEEYSPFDFNLDNYEIKIQSLNN